MVSFSVALDNWELSFEIEYISPQAFEASASSSGGLQCMNDENNHSDQKYKTWKVKVKDMESEASGYDFLTK